MRIREFTSIKIDDFAQRFDEPAPQLCFLTHMHEDHTKGLARKSYYGPYVYCTAATRALLLNYRSKCETGELKYNHLRREVCGKEIIRVLDLDKPYELPYFSTTVEVTLIDANHCPGAAMVLIKPKHCEGTAVLYTGDLRCEKWHLNMILRKPALLPFVKVDWHCESNAINTDKILKPEPISLYVDNTFESHANPYKEYPENHDGIKYLLNLLATYPSEASFCLADGCSGYEEVLILLSKHLKSPVHVSMYQYNLYMLAADTSPLAVTLLNLCTTDLLDENGAPVRVHFCQRNPACPCRDPMSATVFFKPCNQPQPQIVHQQNKPLSKANILPDVMISLSEDHRIFKGPDQRYYYDDKTQRYFPLFPWFYFSRHASYSEIKQLCATFNTCSVRTLEGDYLKILWNSTNTPENHLPLDDFFPNALPSSDIPQSEILHTKPINDPTTSCKRVTSLIGGELKENELLPIMRKRKKIPLHYDRQRDRRSRLKKLQAFRGNLDRSEDPEGSSYDTSDEERGHQAMMFIGNQNTRRLDRLRWHNSFVENERRLRSSLTKSLTAISVLGDHSTLEDPLVSQLVRAVEVTEIDPSEFAIGTHPTNYLPSGDIIIRPGPLELQLSQQSPISYGLDQSGVIGVHSSKSWTNEDTQELCHPDVNCLQDAQDASSLPSPPSTDDYDPDLEYVDETLPEEHSIDELIKRLRENPSVWFEFKFDCLSN